MTIRESLELEHRQLYWEVNELRIIGTPATSNLAEKAERRMRFIERLLGYTPTP
jgi:hypothetical protein